MRLAALVVFLSGVGLALLPWWAPVGLLRDRLADHLSGLLGTKVTISRVSISWARGLELFDLEIASPVHADEPLVRIMRVTCELRPLDLLGRGRPASVQFDRLELFIRLDGDGGADLEQLLRLGQLASGQYRPDRVSICNGVLVLSKGPDALPVRLVVSDARIRTQAGLTPRRVTVSAWVDRGPSTLAAPISLLYDARAADGDGVLRLTALNMPVQILSDLGLVPPDVSGICEVELTLGLPNDKPTHFALLVSGQGISIGQTGGCDLVLRTQGQYSQAEDLLVIEMLDVTGGGMAVSAFGQVHDVTDMLESARSVQGPAAIVDCLSSLDLAVWLELTGGEALESLGLGGVNPVVSLQAGSSPLTAGISLDSSGGGLFEVVLDLPAGADLQIGSWQVEQTEMPLRAELRASFELADGRYLAVGLDGEISAGADTASLRDVRTWIDLVPDRSGPAMATLSGRAELSDCRRLLAGLRGALGHHAAIGGPIGLEFSALLDSRLRHVSVVADLTGAAIGPDGALMKPPGELLTLAVGLTPGEGSQDYVLDAELRAAWGKSSAHVELTGAEPGSESVSGRATFHADVDDPRRLAESSPYLSDLLTACKVQRLSGAVTFEGKAAGRFDWDSSQGSATASLSVGFRKLGFDVNSAPAALNGGLSLVDVAFRSGRVPRIGQIQVNSLTASLGKSVGTVAVDLRDPTTAPRGEITILAETLDLEDLHKIAADPSVPIGQAGPKALSAKARQAVRTDADRIVARVARVLNSAAVGLVLEVDRLKFHDAEAGASYEIRHLKADASVRKGQVRASFISALKGGTFGGSITADLAAEVPSLDLQTRLSSLVADAEVALLLHKVFPGNTPLGTLDRTAQLSYRLADVVAVASEPAYPLCPTEGQAHTVVVDGELEGEIGPSTLGKLTGAVKDGKYRYKVMNAFTTFLPDGSAESDMIFDADLQDLFIEGTTDAANMAVYTVGLLPIGAAKKPMRSHLHHKGRYPMFIFKARIQNMRYHDVKTRYLLPHQSLLDAWTGRTKPPVDHAPSPTDPPTGQAPGR